MMMGGKALFKEMGRQGYASMTKAANGIKSTMKHDAGAFGRARGSFMNHMAGGGSFGSGARTFGRDLMRDVGGKRLAGYGAGAAGATGMAAWGLSD